MKQRTVTIAMAGGGSGGHITPLLSLARELKKADPSCRVVYIGPRGDKVETLSKRFTDFDEVCYIPAGKFRRYHGESLLSHVIDVRTLLLNIRDFFKVIAGIFSARRVLKQLKPDVVFSKGSFVAVPAGIAARMQKIPLVTHDSDVVPGLANKIIGRWAAARATGQPIELYDYPKETIRYTGIPVDERIRPVTESLGRDYKRQIGLPSRADVLLICGGGLGAESINSKFMQIVPKLLAGNPNLHVVHIAGDQNEAKVRAEYKIDPADKHRLAVIGFSNDFHKYSGAADLIVSRAGATTLAEFALAGKPVLLIPAPHLTGGHQLANAKQLTAAGAVELIADEAPADEIFGAVNDLLNDSSKRKSLASKLASYAQPDAGRRLAELLLQTAMAQHPT